MRVIILFGLVIISNVTLAQSALVKNNSNLATKSLRIASDFARKPEAISAATEALFLKKLETKTKDMKEKNDDLFKENQELKTKFAALQIKFLLHQMQSLAIETKQLKGLANVEEIIYDY